MEKTLSLRKKQGKLDVNRELGTMGESFKRKGKGDYYRK